jgi:small conductance mechanosensitive channel
VIIQSRKPVVIGEEITVEGPDGEALSGIIVELNSRAVVFETFDGRTAHVPNGKMLAETFTNNSRRGIRRSEAQVRVELPGTAVEDLMSALTEAAASVEGVQADTVKVLVVAVSPKRFTGRVQFWHSPQVTLGVTSDVVRVVAARLVDRGWAGTVTSNPGTAPLVPSEII